MLCVVIISLFALCVSASILHQAENPFEGRIFGGKNTTIEEFPWQISLRNRGNHHCGGAIYNSTTIITAAHCFQGVQITSLSVVAGTTYKSQIGIERKVREVLIHPQYDKIRFDSDVAILLLDDKLPFSDRISAIPLQESHAEVHEDAIAFITGWGAINYSMESYEVLQCGIVNITNTEFCKNAYTDMLEITNQMICAGDKNGGHDACGGDSGGPLVVRNKLVGVVSFGFGCGESEYPGVYAKISALRDWLDTILL